MDCVPDCDLASLPDDLLDVRQDLSQYSYDPAEMLDSVDIQTGLDGQFGSSQSSSQASDKGFGFIPFGDATCVDDEDGDLFDNYDYIYDNSAPSAGGDAVVAIDHSSDTLENANTAAVLVDVESPTSHSVKFELTDPVVRDYFGNNITFDVKTESSDMATPSTVAYSPDSTNNFLVEDDLTKQLSITDNELLLLSTRDLNRRIRLMTADEQRLLKNRRRTLKNRGYAQTCRTRRVGQRTELEADNDRLVAEVQRLSKDNSLLTAECNRLRQEGAEFGSEQLQGEIERLKANVKVLSNELERLRLEGARVKAERDDCRNRLDLLLSFFSSNGIVIEGVTTQ